MSGAPLVWLALLAASPTQPDGFVGSAVDVAAVEQGIARARRWLVEHQSGDGGFRATVEIGVPHLPLTGLALWALCASDAKPDRVAASRAAEHLCAWQQPSGGIFDPERPFCAQTSAVARQALLRWRDRGPGGAGALDEELRRLEAWLEERSRPLESGSMLATVRSRIGAMRDDSRLTPEERRALDFLERVDKAGDPSTTTLHPLDGGLSYAELLGFLGADLGPDDPMARAVRDELRVNFTLAENPGLSTRYRSGARGRQSGIFYYYLTVARSLCALRQELLVTSGGARIDWREALAHELLERQEHNGSWRNENPHWWESEPMLATCFAVIALEACLPAETKESPR